MTPNGCQTVKGSLSASLSLWAWVLCGLGLQMTWREALTLLCPCWGLSSVICIPLLLTFSFPAVLNGLLLQLPWQLALPMLFSLTGAVGTPVLGIQGSDPRIQPIADGVDFSIQCGLNLWMWSPWIEHPRILVSTGDPGAYPVGDTKGTCISVFFFRQAFPKGASFRSFSSVFSPLSILSPPMTFTLISALVTITPPGPCSKFQTLISSCTQVFQRLLINSSYHLL